MSPKSTPATRQLTDSLVPFRVHTYQVKAKVGEGYGEAVAAAIGMSEGAVYKTLVVVIDDDHALAVVPVAAQLSLKALARFAGAKKAKLADTATAERQTGYRVGGISPLGLRRRIDVYLDQSAVEQEKIAVSGGQRGVQIELSAGDLAALTDAKIGVIARGKSR